MRVSVPISCGSAGDRKSTRLNSSHLGISYAVFCLKKKNRVLYFSPRRGGGYKHPPSPPVRHRGPSAPVPANHSRDPRPRSCPRGRGHSRPVRGKLDMPARRLFPARPASEKCAWFGRSCFLLVGLQRGLQRVRLLQKFLHPRPPLARTLFLRAPALPVSLKAHGEVVAVALERLELASPLNHSSAHRRPVVPLSLLDCIFAVAVTNAFLGQQIVAIWVWNFAAGGGIARVPVQHERRSLDRTQIGRA